MCWYIDETWYAYIYIYIHMYVNINMYTYTDHNIFLVSGIFWARFFRQAQADYGKTVRGIVSGEPGFLKLIFDRSWAADTRHRWMGWLDVEVIRIWSDVNDGNNDWYWCVCKFTHVETKINDSNDPLSNININIYQHISTFIHIDISN